MINSRGQPLFKDGNGDDWQYQNFEVEVEYGVVEEISTKSNAVAKPDGIRVGNAAEILSSTFGKADKVEVESDHTEYTYYSTDQTKKSSSKLSTASSRKSPAKLEIKSVTNHLTTSSAAN